MYRGEDRRLCDGGGRLAASNLSEVALSKRTVEDACLYNFRGVAISPSPIEKNRNSDTKELRFLFFYGIIELQKVKGGIFYENI